MGFRVSYIGGLFELYWANGKSNGNDYYCLEGIALRRVLGVVVFLVFWVLGFVFFGSVKSFAFCFLVVFRVLGLGVFQRRDSQPFKIPFRGVPILRRTAALFNLHPAMYGHYQMLCKDCDGDLVLRGF